jgi:hypothetical protein
MKGRKPLTQAEIDELNGLRERAAILMEQHKKFDEARKLRSGVLAQIRDEPRDE